MSGPSLRELLDKLGGTPDYSGPGVREDQPQEDIMIEQDIGDGARPQVEQGQHDPEAWKKRVIEEYEDLSAKLDRLNAYLDRIEAGEEKVDPITRSLLVAQHGVMTGYKGILAIRLNARVQVTA